MRPLSRANVFSHTSRGSTVICLQLATRAHLATLVLAPSVVFQKAAVRSQRPFYHPNIGNQSYFYCRSVLFSLASFVVEI
jgi:hypothetical protein